MKFVVQLSSTPIFKIPLYLNTLLPLIRVLKGKKKPTKRNELVQRLKINFKPLMFDSID